MADTKRNANNVGALNAFGSVSVSWTDGVHGRLRGLGSVGDFGRPNMMDNMRY
jgi:hypothetical protein